jgi:hypothetical protein
MTRVTSAVRSLWETDRPLTAAAALLFAALLVTLCGLWLDPRTITGVPAWLKPAKSSSSASRRGAGRRVISISDPPSTPSYSASWA